MSKAFTSKYRLRVIVALISFAFCVLFARLFFLHVVDSERLKNYAESTRKTIQNLMAKRGDILDVKGNVLASTHSTYTIGVDPNFIDFKDENKWVHLAFVLQIPYEELMEKFNRKFRANGRLIRWTPLVRDVNLSVYKAVKALEIQGVYGNRKYSRLYPAKSLAAHVIGFVNHESVAVSGVERMCDYYLSGQDGWLETEKDGLRRELAHMRSREIAPVNGHSVYLTIDQRIQSAVEEEIEAIVEQYKPEGVSVIVSKPEDGSILALANYPTFDLNEFNNLSLYPLSHQRNRAITDLLEPGSTFKIVPASGALNEGIVNTWDVFQTGQDRVHYKNRMVRLPSDHRLYPELTMKEIVVKSSNRGAAHLGMLLGDKRLHGYAEKFGFGSRTQFGLSGEVSGTLHPIDRWDGLTISHMPMGHAINATPLQIHFAMSVIANKGILMKPKLIDRFVDESGTVLFEYPAQAKHRVISESVAATMSELLGDVASPTGTARRASLKSYSVAGKTGTTQKIIDDKYSKDVHVASFSGFLPQEKPELVITVIVDAPKLKGRVGYGGTVAAPAFKNIAQKCVRILEIRPSEYIEEWIARNPNPNSM